MAEFTPAYNTVKKHEGGYAFLVGDKGGQTYAGIARNFFPGWAGWATVDFFVDHKYNGDPKKVPNNTVIPGLEFLVSDFYATLFTKNNFDKITSQNLANFYFDYFVNSGAKAIKDIQSIVGVTPDGIQGAKTIAAINAKNPELLYTQIYAKREALYKRLGASMPQFLKGWLSRLRSFPSSIAAATKDLPGGTVAILIGLLFILLLMTRK